MVTHAATISLVGALLEKETVTTIHTVRATLSAGWTTAGGKLAMTGWIKSNK